MSSSNPQTGGSTFSIGRSLPSSVLAPLVHASSMREAMSVSVEIIGRALGVSRCAVLALERDAPLLPGIIEWIRDEPEPQSDEVAIELYRALQQQCLVANQPLVVEDVHKHQELAHLHAHCAALGISSIFALNSRDTNAANATLVLLQANFCREWTESDIAFVNNIAAHFGLVFSHLREFEALQAKVKQHIAGNGSTAQFEHYRLEARKLSVLYRMTSLLTGNLGLAEMFQIAFEFLSEELELKRLWLGLLNEAGTRLVGQAAYGPGWKRKLVEINVEIRGREHPIARAVTSRRAVIIEDPETLLNEFGVRKIFSQLAIRSIVLVPLVSGSQVLGVLAVQPDSRGPEFDSERLNLLSSLAAELANRVRARLLEERAGEGDKMRAAGLLAAGIAHNFNNLLQAILGQASLLEIQGEQNAKVKKAANVISGAAYKGAEMVKKLLSVAQLEEPRMEEFGVSDLLERYRDKLQNLLKPGQRLLLHLNGDLPRVRVDPVHIMRIVESLIINAVEADQNAGEIELFTADIEIDDSKPHYEVPNGRYVQISVRDSGKGMSEEVRRRCFEPFFTTKDVDPRSGLGLSGAGLGLAAAYALARRNRGFLTAEGRPGKGSVFTLFVPVASGPVYDSHHRSLSDAIDVVRVELAKQSRQQLSRR